MSEGREELPAWKSFEDCKAYAEEKGDSFYITAFMLECWIGDVQTKAIEQFSKKAKPAERAFQSGGAWESWNDVFGHAKPEEWPYLLDCIGRYSQCVSNEMPRILHSALNLLAIEDKHGEPILPRFPNPAKVKPEIYIEAMRLMFRRLSEWLDSVICWDTRLHHAIVPKAFTGNETHIELYAIGLMQAGFSHLGKHGKDWWSFRHDDLSSKVSLDEWRTVGEAQSNRKFGELKHPEVDEAIIHCWPLVKRHAWTDEDLRVILCQLVKHPKSYPLRDEREFSDYRGKIGLKRPKGIRCKSHPQGKPDGWKVAFAMCGMPLP
jgi:hypothetical protein